MIGTFCRRGAEAARLSSHISDDSLVRENSASQPVSRLAGLMTIGVLGGGLGRMLLGALADSVVLQQQMGTVGFAVGLVGVLLLAPRENGSKVQGFKSSEVHRNLWNLRTGTLEPWNPRTLEP